MKYKWKSHFTSTLLFATIITALIAIIKQYTTLGAIIFAVVSVGLLAAYRHVENQENEESDDKKKKERSRPSPRPKERGFRAR
jgi:4-hydroxybenzoate polyprenyltransferase